MTYKLKKFDLGTIDTTESAWVAQANKHPEACFPTDVQKDFSWIRSSVSGSLNDDRIHYGLFRDGNEVADAAIQLIHTKRSPRSAWLKLIELNFSPEIMAKGAKGDPHTVSAVLSMFSQAVTGSIQLCGKEHKSDTLKLYGRTDSLLQFLILFTGVAKIKNVNITMEGRWLVLRPKTN